MRGDFEIEQEQVKKLRLLLLVAFACRCVQAQGTVYLSNLGAPSMGSYSVASDSWLAVGFRTGSNTGGYLLDSVTLAMLDAIGNPSSFVVSLYWSSVFAPRPGSSLSPLLGTTDPQSAGLYTFVAPPNLLLLPNTTYYIAVSEGATTASGAYQWGTADMSPNLGGNGWSGGGVFVSADGLPAGWNSIPGYTQFALNATAIPEPSAFALILLGGILLCRRAHIGT